MDNLLINYGEIIKKARKERKITQTVLGAKIGVGKTAVCNYETSANLPPRNMFLKIAEALSYTPEEMISRFMPRDALNLGDPHIVQPRFSAPITRINNSTCDEGASIWHTNDSFSFPSDVLSGDEQYVCFKAADNSMADDGILKNDHLFVRLTKDIPQKSIVLFKNFELLSFLTALTKSYTTTVNIPDKSDSKKQSHCCLTEISTFLLLI